MNKSPVKGVQSTRRKSRGGSRNWVYGDHLQCLFLDAKGTKSQCHRHRERDAKIKFFEI